MKKITLALALLCTLGLTTLSAQVNFEKRPLAELYPLLEGNKRLVFVDLYASWCPPCKMMERDVFSRSDVGDFMNTNFVSAKYNVDETLGRDLSRTYQVSSIPTYLIFDSKGNMVGRYAGAMPAADFIANMQQLLDKSN